MNLVSKITNLKRFYIRKTSHNRKEFSIVRGTLTKYGLPTKCFDNNADTLIMDETDDKGYYYKTNTLKLPKKSEDLVCELFRMASNNFDNKETLTGCEIQNGNLIYAKSLDEGIIDYFTSLCFKNYKFIYPVESFFAYYLSKIYGFSIYREYFNGNAIEFFASFNNDEPFIRSFVDDLDKYHQYSNNKLRNETNAVSASEALINCMVNFVKLLELKGLDEDEFLDEFINILNNDKNENVNLVNYYLKNGVTKGKEYLFSTVKRNVNKEGVKL